MARIVRAGIFVALPVVLFEIITLSLAVKDLVDGSSALTSVTRSIGRSHDNWTDNRIAEASVETRNAQGMVGRARSRLDGDPVLEALRHAPVIGDQVRATRDLAAAADSSGRALADFLVLAGQFDASRRSAGPAGPRLVNLVRTAVAPLGDASERLNGAIDLLDQDGRHRLVPPLRDSVDKALAQLRPVGAQTSLLTSVARLAPSALGAGTSRSYLLLFANPSEIRPGGGFVGAVGDVTMTDGAPEQLQVRDEAYFTPLFKHPFPPPYPLPRYFNYKTNPFELGEAGWDPDFPADARTSEAMFNSATGRSVDGTLSLDPYAISAALAVTGPVEVPGIGTFDQNNFFPSVNFIVNVKKGPGSGKSALPIIARAIVQRVLTMPLEQWPRLLAAEQDQARGRHVLIYLHDPELAAAAARAHYDGAVLTAASDSLMVVDGNVGATKGDYYVHKAIDMKAELTTGGVSRHQLTLTYMNPLPVDDIDRALNQQNAGAYSDYLRIYVPETTSNVEFKYSEDGGDGFGGLDRIDVAGGKRVVAIFFHLPRGHLGTLQVNYDVALDGGRTYRLDVQKEAGIPDRKMTVKISYPGGLATRKSDGATDAEFKLGW